MSNRIGIGLFGCGAVGSAVAQLLLDQRSELAERTGATLDLRRVVVRDLGKRRSVLLPEGVLTDDAAELARDGAIQIVVELAGGTDEAVDLTLAALRAGKDVVTANTAMLATHGAELFAAARRASRCLAFEASVAGGLPLIELVRRGLVANDVHAVHGILNGASNYILTRMLDNNASYAYALAEAQRLGHAGTDPTPDVDGSDSACKLAILASLAMRSNCPLDRIRTEGIQHLDLIDLRAGLELGYTCRLLAKARRCDDGLDLCVEPTFVPGSHPLAHVSGVNNAVSLCGHAAGHLHICGAGTGGMPAASAVVSDIVDVAIGTARKTFESFAVLPDQTRPPILRTPGEHVSRYYLRVGLLDRPGAIGRVTTALGRAGISIAAMVQHDAESAARELADVVPVMVITRPVRDRDIRASLETMSELGSVVGPPVCIPILHTPADGEASV